MHYGFVTTRKQRLRVLHLGTCKMNGFARTDITVISVCYKSDAVIGEMVNSIPRETPIILVDNAGTNNFDSIDSRKKIDIVQLAENQGFGRGCNAGASKAETPWLLFLNPDARLADGALDVLLEAARKYPKASAFNPRFTNNDGNPYFKRRSYLLPHNEYMKRGWPKHDCEVPVLSGAAILISKRIFDQVGRFDPNIFLYHEDDDISLRLRKHGSLMFVRDALVFHKGGRSSTRTADIAYFKAFHMAQSRVYAGRKHGRPLPRVSAVLHGLLQILITSAFFSKRRWAKSRGFLIGACSRKTKARRRL